MNSQNKSDNTKLKSKGDRLNWTPLSMVKPVSLNEASLKGKRLSTSDLKTRNLISNKEFILVP
jgi:hypothetical protein